MPIDCYYFNISAPCRAVLLTAKMVGVEMNLKSINLLAGEHMEPYFIKINPAHQVPTIDDAGFILSESRAICAYLANKYGRDDKLYSKVPKERAIIDQRLYFDMGVFYKSFSDYYYPVIFGGATSLNHDKTKDLDIAMALMSLYLSDHTYAAGDHMTIADLALVASASTMEFVDEKIFDNYPQIKEWLGRCKKEIHDYHNLNHVGAEAFGQLAKGALAKIQ